MADLPALRYTELVVTESMRLYPPAYVIGRQATRPTEVAGHAVPARGIVIMPTWVVQRDARWFDEPETFRPERWANDAARRFPRFAYFPFGGGPRQCIGNTFATMEVSDEWRGPTFLGYGGLLERMRFAVDPSTNGFHFGSYSEDA